MEKGNENPSHPRNQTQKDIVSTLPCAIIDSILLKLSDDPSSLAKCAMVSHTFHLAGTKHIYRTINVDMTRQDTFSLHQTLIHRKDIFIHVRRLFLRSPKRRAIEECDNVPNEFLELLMQGLISATTTTGSSIGYDDLAGLRALDIGQTNWFDLSNETILNLVNLIRLSTRLHILYLPVFSSNCNIYKSLLDIISKSVVPLRHLGLRGSADGIHPEFVQDDAAMGDLDSVLKSAFPVAEQIQIQKGPHEKNVIESLKIENVGDPLEEHLFYPTCPLDFSHLTELHLVGIEEIRSPCCVRSLIKLLKISCQSIDSLVWKWDLHRYHPPSWSLEAVDDTFGRYLGRWDSNSNSDSDSDSQPPVSVQLRYLTLCTPSKDVLFGIDRAFFILVSRLGIQADDIQELNLSYSYSYSHSYGHSYDGYSFASGSDGGSLIGEQHQSIRSTDDNNRHRLEHTLQRAESEFRTLQDSGYHFPNLEKIHLLLIRHSEDLEVTPTEANSGSEGWEDNDDSQRTPHRVLFDTWTPSGKWKMASEIAPALHSTGKLFLRTARASMYDQHCQEISPSEMFPYKNHYLDPSWGA